MTDAYREFVAGKLLRAPPVGITTPVDLPSWMFPFQADIVRWALKRGRASIFSDCGTGKTAMELEWARQVAAHTGGKILILAPLAVAQQTVREGEKFGIPARYARGMSDANQTITVANYEMLQHFDPSQFAGIVADESGIIKSKDGKTRTAIIESFKHTPFKLACTATPSPNDYMELGNHSEFLGILSYTEMLATFFVHDGGETQKWRLKGHAERDFWKWLCSWAVMIRSPADLNYPAGDFVLPPLHMHEHLIKTDIRDAWKSGSLFAQDALTLNDQRRIRRATIDKRVELAAKMINDSTDPWVVWCELNEEGDALEKAIPDAIQVAGSDPSDVKEKRLIDFSEGRARVIISKVKIAGFGMNWQHCNQMLFMGASHSYEQTYQAIRREWRFGQKRPVNVHVFAADGEGAIVTNWKRKEADAAKMAAAMLEHMRDIQRVNIGGSSRQVIEYNPIGHMRTPEWLIESEF